MVRLLSTLLCFLVSGFVAHAQFSKGDIILDLSGSYIESYSSSGVTLSQYSTKTKTLDMSVSMGYCVTASIAMDTPVSQTIPSTLFTLKYYEGAFYMNR